MMGPGESRSAGHGARVEGQVEVEEGVEEGEAEEAALQVEY